MKGIYISVAVVIAIAIVLSNLVYFVFAGVILGVFLILLPYTSVAWMPFAVLITFLIAYMRNQDTKLYTQRGALYSLLLIMPWIYLTVRMFGNRVPTGLIKTGYIILYFLWAAATVMGVWALTFFKHSYHSLYGPNSDYPHQAALNAAVAFYLAVTVIALFHSILELRRARDDYSERGADAKPQPVFPGKGFLTPFIYGFVGIALPIPIAIVVRRWYGEWSLGFLF